MIMTKASLDEYLWMLRDAYLIKEKVYVAWQLRSTRQTGSFALSPR